MRSITNVYMIGLCLADFIYLANLTLVAAAQLNNKSWIFGSLMCTLYHGTETTSKYASIIFVVLLAADRYYAMCRPDLCTRHRNYLMAVSVSGIAWILAFSAAIPLYLYSEVVQLRTHGITGLTRPICIAKWPSSTSARWYITSSSILIYVIPLALMTYFNYHVLTKLREALRRSKRMQRTSKSRAPYHRVTRLVLWVVIFHAACWSPFWLFNLLSSVFRLRVHTRFDRLIVNVIHLFPYINCAMNPLLYAVNAANFRRAFRSLFTASFINKKPLQIAKRRTSQAVATKLPLVQM
uniref:G-protein coupled receptors family 1 profile domain-containing protein n=1 Tax=Setaria digitata TaxID=48799 RepID=A0A915PYB1_9BILA